MSPLPRDTPATHASIHLWLLKSPNRNTLTIQLAHITATKYSVTPMTSSPALTHVIPEWIPPEARRLTYPFGAWATKKTVIKVPWIQVPEHFTPTKSRTRFFTIVPTTLTKPTRIKSSYIPIWPIKTVPCLDRPHRDLRRFYLSRYKLKAKY